MSTYIKELGQKAKAAAADLAGLTRQEKNACLRAAADQLVADAEPILRANARDMAEAARKGMKESLQDRLRLTEKRIQAMA